MFYRLNCIQDTCDMTQVYASRHVHMCDMTHVYALEHVLSSELHTRHVWHDSSICVTTCWHAGHMQDITLCRTLLLSCNKRLLYARWKIQLILTHIHESCPTYERVVTHILESCHTFVVCTPEDRTCSDTYTWVTSHIWTCCDIYTWVMPHVCVFIWRTRLLYTLIQWTHPHPHPHTYQPTPTLTYTHSRTHLRTELRRALTWN